MTSKIRLCIQSALGSPARGAELVIIHKKRPDNFYHAYGGFFARHACTGRTDMLKFTKLPGFCSCPGLYISPYFEEKKRIARHDTQIRKKAAGAAAGADDVLFPAAGPGLRRGGTRGRGPNAEPEAGGDKLARYADHEQRGAGGIDTAILKSAVTLTVTPKGVNADTVTLHPGNIKILEQMGKMPAEDVTELFDIRESGPRVFTISEKEPYSLWNGYSYTAVIEKELGGGTVSCQVKLPVKFSSPAKVTPSVTLKAAGFIDVIRPGSSITLTPTVKNCFTYAPKETDLQIEKQDGRNWVPAAVFNVTVENGVYVLTLKEDSGVDHTKDKFRVRLSTEVEAIYGRAPLISPWVNLTVKMGAAKITQSVKAVTLLADDCYDRAAVKLTTADPTLSDIDHVELVPPRDKLKRDVFALTELGGGEYAIGYSCYGNDEPRLPLPGFKGGTAKLNVFLVGNNSGKPNATLSVSVKLG